MSIATAPGKVKSPVFQPGRIGNLVIKNRLVRSATHEGRAGDDGSVTDDLLKVYRGLAEGGVGLIVTGLAYVQQGGKGAPNQTGIYSDRLIPGLKKLARTVHERGDGCKIAVQLAHSGRQSFILDEVVAPSAVLEPLRNIMPREMTAGEIGETIEAFAEAACRAREAGFDAVQLHAAHGYLLSEFLSPHTNRRTDDYGGSTDKRIRIVEEIYGRIVARAGRDFPVFIKMNADDYLEDGINLAESRRIARRLSGMGMAAIEVSGGMWEVRFRPVEQLGWQPGVLVEAREGIDSKDKEAYHLPYAREIKKVISVPLILVGGMRSLDLMEEVLEGKIADFIAMCRPFIRQPSLPNRWLKGTAGMTARCISCSGCLLQMMSGPVKCDPQEC